MLGSLSGKKIVAGCTGVGKVAAAMTAQGVIDRHKPDALVFAGIAGALNTSYEIGDIIIAVDCIQHDIDARRFGFRRGEVPKENIVETASDPRLVEYALGWGQTSRALHVGRILSGDRFVTTAGESEDGYLRDELRGDAVDMESAAAAYVAGRNTVPFVAVRVISDKADGTMPGEFRAFLWDTSLLLLDLARYFTGLRFAAGSGNE
jgi:5'-methylthioadenosine/S-adenosylhomocysteine nucleosidase